MRKRPLFLYACVFSAGILYARFEVSWMIALFIIWLGYEWYISLRTGCVKHAAGRSVLLLSAFLLGAVHTQQEMSFREKYLSEVKDGASVTVWGEISKIETTSTGKTRLILSDCYISLKKGVTPCNDIMVYTDSDQIGIGQIRKITGEIHIWEQARNEGGFDSAVFYLSQKIDLCIYEKESVLIEVHAGWIEEVVWALKAAIKKVYETVASEKLAGFLNSMILGDKSNLDEGLKALFTDGGIAHILAISGLHVSIIGKGFYKWVRKRRIGFCLAGCLAGGLLCAYCYMVGNGMSAVRAVGMMLIFFLGQMLGRSYDLLNALGAVVCFLLWENPFLLEYSGLWFSVSALIGVAYVGDAFSKLSEKGSSLLTSLGIYLSTLPVVAYCYYEIPLYSPLVNFLLLPLLTPIFVIALLGGGVGLLSISLAEWILVPCELGLMLYEWICQLVAKLPFAMIITGKPSLLRIVVYYLVLVVGMLVHKKCSRQKMLVTAITVACCMGLIILPKGQTKEITFLDVGQGDGIYIGTGDGISYFIDGGSTDVNGVGEYRILPFLKSNDIEKIDYWFVTHTDTDHISGLLEVIESGYRIEHLVVADVTVASSVREALDGIMDEKLLELLESANEAQIEMVYMQAGDCLKTRHTTLTCVYPGKEDAISNPSIVADKNDASLVLEFFTYNTDGEEFSAIFTGDISSEVEERLLNEGRLSEVSLYKAAHHGSKYSNALETLLTLSPEIAVVSCGANNWYGHPAWEAISHMTEAGADIYYTMDVGQVTIEIRREDIKITEYLTPQD